MDGRVSRGSRLLSASSARTSGAVRLVVNADDFGIAKSVNRGIVESIEHGVVTSASLMVNMPACEDAIRRVPAVLAVGKAIGIGLHFNIVSGPPLTACATLVDRRRERFLRLPQLVWRAFAGRLSIDDVQGELDAQLQRSEQLLEPLGLRVTHIDSHRHAHCLPGVHAVVLRTAKRRGIGHVRHPYEIAVDVRQPRAFVAMALLKSLLPRLSPIDDVRFTGFGAMGSRDVERDLFAIVSRLPQGTTELMVHPGYDSPELAALDPYRVARERELRALTSPAMRARIRELGVELTHFGALATARPA